MSDIAKLIDNLGEKERQTIIEIAISMARSKQAEWTGRVVWELHFSQGSVGDAEETTNRSVFRKRRVRSKGIA